MDVLLHELCALRGNVASGMIMDDAIMVYFFLELMLSDFFLMMLLGSNKIIPK